MVWLAWVVPKCKLNYGETTNFDIHTLFLQAFSGCVAHFAVPRAREKRDDIRLRIIFHAHTWRFLLLNMW